VLDFYRENFLTLQNFGAKILFSEMGPAAIFAVLFVAAVSAVLPVDATRDRFYET
jgi:hypothetical protein